MIPLRGVSAKLLLAMTVAVLVPFLGFSYFVSTAMGHRLSRDVVSYFLKSKANDLADKINLLLAERWRDLTIWVKEPVARDFLLRPDAARRREMEGLLDTFCYEKQVYDLILIADIEGRVVATNTIRRDGKPLPETMRARIFALDVRRYLWFAKASGGDVAAVDWHITPLLHERPEVMSDDPRDYAVGFAMPVRDSAGRVIGVWYNVMNWAYVQIEILDKVGEYFAHLRSPGAPSPYQSGYAWLWKRDGDTIIGHKNRDLYGKSVSGDPVYLPQLTQAALKQDWGDFPEYQFPPGTLKNASFRWTNTVEEGGFGWIVGLGIDNRDILATVSELRLVLVGATILIMASIVGWTWVISRTITRPVRSLIAFTEEVAKGNLDARVDVRSEDELGVLARSFNRMAGDLAASREQLIRAEKEAAWREMARQIAHEIKNPLTPMRLSTTLLKKAYDDHSPEFPRIFAQTTEAILTHVEVLRRIAADFSTFAGLPQRRVEPVPVAEVLKDCLNLYEGWAREKAIVTSQEGEAGLVLGDREELRRLFINLLENAFEAVGGEGTVRVVSTRRDGFLDVEVIDSGPGIAPEVQARLFQPYFSTKTTGTGLGLAICHRIVTEMQGTITVSSEAGQGTVVRVSLPRAAAGDTRG